MKIYGNENTDLTLSDKAFAVYSETDPLRIMEEDDGTYTITGVIDRNGMTAEQVNRVLESFSDETAYRVLPEYIDAWSDQSECPDELIVTREEIERLAGEWGVDVDALLEQVEEI